MNKDSQKPGKQPDQGKGSMNQQQQDGGGHGQDRGSQDGKRQQQGGSKSR